MARLYERRFECECLEVFDRAAYESSHEDVLARIPDITARLGDPA